MYIQPGDLQLEIDGVVHAAQRLEVLGEFSQCRRARDIGALEPLGSSPMEAEALFRLIVFKRPVNGISDKNLRKPERGSAITHFVPVDDATFHELIKRPLHPGQWYPDHIVEVGALEALPGNAEGTQGLPGYRRQAAEQSGGTLG